jgi:hypothetical protein
VEAKFPRPVGYRGNSNDYSSSHILHILIHNLVSLTLVHKLKKVYDPGGNIDIFLIILFILSM